MKTAKRLMTKALEDKADPFLALLDWRNTPSEQLQQSPVQILFGRRTRTKLPMAKTLLHTPETCSVKNALFASKNKQAAYYNRHTKEKPSLKVGQTVRFQPDDSGEWRKGTIKQTLPFRSYDIQLEDGSTRRRTSKHVRYSAEPPIVLREDENNETGSSVANDVSTDTMAVRHGTIPVTQSATLVSTTSAHDVDRRGSTGSSPGAPVMRTRSGRIVVPPAR